MSANAILQKQVDGLDVLRELLALDPKKVAADQEAIRNQIQLTAEQEGKVAEAKSYIAKHDSLVAELKAREDAHAANKVAHELEVSKFKDYSETETKRLNDLCTVLGNKQIELDGIDKRQKDEAAKIATGWSSLEQEKRNHANAVSGYAAENARVQSANKLEAQRLKDWEETLKAKAQRIRDQISAF